MKLVSVNEHGLEGINFYHRNHEKYNITIPELEALGIFDDRAYVSEEIIPSLISADQEFWSKYKYHILIKDAYRSEGLYKLIQQKRYDLMGKERTDKLLNLETMPHSSGKAVDIALLDEEGTELWMRNGGDGDDAYFIDFYASKTDKTSVEYQRRQLLLREVMLNNGFKLGVKNEYWHFEYV